MLFFARNIAIAIFATFISIPVQAKGPPEEEQLVPLTTAAQKVVDDLAQEESSLAALDAKDLLMAMNFDSNDVENALRFQEFELLLQLQSAPKGAPQDKNQSLQVQLYRIQMHRIKQSFTDSDREFHQLLRPLRTEIYDFARNFKVAPDIYAQKKRMSVVMEKLAESIRDVNSFQGKLVFKTVDEKMQAKANLMKKLATVLKYNLELHALATRQINAEPLPSEIYFNSLGRIVSGAAAGFLASISFVESAVRLGQITDAVGAIFVSSTAVVGAVVGLVIPSMAKSKALKDRTKMANQIRKELNEHPERATLKYHLDKLNVKNSEELARLAATPGGLMSYFYLLMRNISDGDVLPCTVSQFVTIPDIL